MIDVLNKKPKLLQSLHITKVRSSKIDNLFTAIIYVKGLKKRKIDLREKNVEKTKRFFRNITPEIDIYESYKKF